MLFNVSIWEWIAIIYGFAMGWILVFHQDLAWEIRDSTTPGSGNREDWEKYAWLGGILFMLLAVVILFILISQRN